jgi:hypothetical protein
MSSLSPTLISSSCRRGFRSTARVAVGGLGYGNVQDRMLAREHLYHHTDEPHTVSIIGELKQQQNQINPSLLS